MAVDRQQRSAAVAYRAGTKHGPSFDLKDRSIDEVWLVTSAELFFPLGQDLLGFSEKAIEEFCLWMTDVSNLSEGFICYPKYDGVMQVELKDSRNSKDPVKEIQTALTSLKWDMTTVPKSEGGLSLMNCSPLVQAVMVYMKDHSPITPEELNFHAELKAASQWSCSDDYKQLVLKKAPDGDCRLKIAVKTALVTWGEMVNDLQKRDSSNKHVDNQLSDYRKAIGVLKNYLEKGKINSTSEPLQLVRIGGQNDPFEGSFRTANGDSYENYVAYADKWVPGRSDFHLDDDGQIIPELSCGLSIFADIENLPQEDSEHPERLWMLQKEITNSGELKYPTEIEITLENANNGQYLIKPTEPVTLETFIQMLRRLPWVKMYSSEELKNKFD